VNRKASRRAARAGSDERKDWVSENRDRGLVSDTLRHRFKAQRACVSDGRLRTAADAWLRS
jgi:hypothetical protein